MAKNEPAFPQDNPVGESDKGMSLRDYFAAKAMQAYVSDSDSDWCPSDYKESTARNAYLMADAMLAEREKAGSE